MYLIEINTPRSSRQCHSEMMVTKRDVTIRPNGN